MKPNVDSRRPFVFSDASVNLVVLPYSYTGTSNEPLSEVGHQLSVLVHLDTLFSILKYGSIGAVQIVVRPGAENESTPDIILAKLLGEQPGAGSEIRSRHGLVLFWGRIYEEGDDIYVQSYVRFLRRDVPEDLVVQIGGRPFVGRLAAQAFAFSPRKLSRQDVIEIGRQFAASATLHSEPKETAPGRPLVGDQAREEPYGYWVDQLSTDNAWLHLEPGTGGTGGWINRQQLSGGPLHRKLPELGFVEALVGYLQLRCGQEASTLKPPADTQRWVDEALRLYMEDSSTRQSVRARLATAVGEQLTGILRMLNPNASASNLADAQRSFDAAAALVPYSADARNLALLARLSILQKSGQLKRSGAATADDLVAAVALEPQNDQVLGNLQSLYEALLPPCCSSESEGTREFRNRLDAVRKVRSALRPGDKINGAGASGAPH